ncbi:MAG TPA: amidohydrolase family protein, partial [Pseudonocardia sp.]|nr:amidohydrolase family protein [Pseudonocardia sp.]
MLYGGDYNIWTPKWQVEGLVDWQMPDEDQFSDYPRLTTDSKKKILGLNAARLYGIDVPADCQLGATTAAGDADAPGEELVSGSAGTQA